MPLHVLMLNSIFGYPANSEFRPMLDFGNVIWVKALNCAGFTSALLTSTNKVEILDCEKSYSQCCNVNCGLLMWIN